MKTIYNWNNLKRLKFIGLLLILSITTLIYSNHFDNPFFFDDSHTIEGNNAITSLDKWSSFFTDATTFSSLPANRAYRPMMTLMNAIDYSFAGGLDSFYFHLHIFFWYLITIILFFILSNYLYQNANNSNQKSITTVALLTTLFLLHIL
tara:strand:+ start:117 stop:563 length:447 start_codon:yes stop_codon:yes gene_type:complete